MIGEPEAPRCLQCATTGDNFPDNMPATAAAWDEADKADNVEAFGNETFVTTMALLEARLDSVAGLTAAERLAIKLAQEILTANLADAYG